MGQSLVEKWSAGKWCALACLVALLGAQAEAAVWESKQTWSDAWETQYRAWVAREWDKGFYLKPGPLNGLAADCADAVYTMRAAFAAQHELPFVIKDPTTHKGPPISNQMTRWDKQKPEQRLRSFIVYVFNVVSTASLPDDTYPAAISSTAIGAGTVIATDKKSHHSWTIQKFSVTGIPHLVFASRPASSTLYERFEYPTPGFIFPSGIRPETNGGFRNFRWPADIGKPVHEVTGFSLEQYAIPPASWTATIQKRMQQVEETAEQRALRLYAESCRGADERIAIVQGALSKNAAIGARCMNAVEFDDHSTPNRDFRLKATFQELEAAYRDSQNGALLSASTRQSVQSVLSGDAAASDSAAACVLSIGGGIRMALGQIYLRSTTDRLSSNPHDTLEMRWGLENWPSVKAKSCPVY